MTTTAPILVCIDGSDSSWAALDLALREFPGRHLDLLYCYMPLEPMAVEDFVFMPSAEDNAKVCSPLVGLGLVEQYWLN